GTLGQARQVLADLEAWHRCRDGPEFTAVFHGGGGFGVPGVLLRGAAPHEQEDARAGAPPWGIGGTTALQQGGQPQSEKAQRARAQELPAVYTGVSQERAAGGWRHRFDSSAASVERRPLYSEPEKAFMRAFPGQRQDRTCHNRRPLADVKGAAGTL